MFDTREMSPTAHRALATVLADQPLRPATFAAERTLPVGEAFVSFLPGGLPRGVTVVVRGVAGPSFALGLLGAATRQRSWLAVVGLRGLSWLAAAELGVDLGCVVAVEPVPVTSCAATVSALLDGFDAVLMGPAVSVDAAVARRLAARARERGTVLVCLAAWPGGGEASPVERVWSGASDVMVDAHSAGWEGLEVGAGRVTRRQVQVRLEGRRVPGRQRRGALWLPAA